MGPPLAGTKGVAGGVSPEDPVPLSPDPDPFTWRKEPAPAGDVEAGEFRGSSRAKSVQRRDTRSLRRETDAGLAGQEEINHFPPSWRAKAFVNMCLN